MDDGPEDEIMQLEGYGRQLESSFDKLGMSDTSKKQEEEKLVLPFSDVEFAAQFLGLAEVESVWLSFIGLVYHHPFSENI